MRKFGLGHVALCAIIAALAACDDTGSYSTPSAATGSGSGSTSGSSSSGGAGAGTGTSNTGGSALNATNNGAVGMSAATYSVTSSAGSVTLAAQRVGGTKGALTVTYDTVSESAVAGRQFTATSGTLKWADGDGANKSFAIPVAKSSFAGTKSFAVRLAAGPNTILGSHTSATINIVGAAPTGGTGGTTTPTGGSGGTSSGGTSSGGTSSGGSSSGGSSSAATKSIRQWVRCDDTDETPQVEEALQMAANNAFTVIVDCAVRLHTASASKSIIQIPDGVTIQFEGAGEFRGHATAFAIAHPAAVTFIDWNYTYL